MIEDQPPPIQRPEHVAVWDLVMQDARARWHGILAVSNPGQMRSAIRDLLDDMQARDQVGRERYGTPLTTHNGRKHLVDAYQEGLDLVVYLRAELEEHPDDARTYEIQKIYEGQLDVLLRLRGFLSERGDVIP